MCEYCCYPHNCEAHPDAKIELSSESIVEAMNIVLGEDIRQRCRRNMLVWARNMVAFRLMLNGSTQKEAAALVGLDRSAMVYCAKQVRRMLENPRAYAEEFRLWRKFNTALSQLNVLI